MRSLLVAWLERHGLPGWLAPDYMTMVGIAALLGAAITMWLSERDGADTRVERRALVATYLGALAGGYIFEWLRVLPEVAWTQSWEPLLHVGRAAYGGLLIGTLSAIVVLRRGGATVRPFLDRTVPLCGISYGLVRTGCFLAGCDYGKPTASVLGVRFPAGSSAAVDHASLGWVPRGGESLPVHATQLYEAAIGVVAAGLASLWLIKGKRDGRAFATFVALYAIGRFFVEMLRGDGSRGSYGTISTAQWVSIGLIVAVGALVWHAKRETRRMVAVAASATMLLVCQDAIAQSWAGDAPAAPPPVSASASAAPPAPPSPAASASASSTPPNIPPPPPVPGAQPYPLPGAQPNPGQPGAYPYPYPPAPGAQPYPYPYPYPPPGAQPYPYPYPYPPPGTTPPPAAGSKDGTPPQEEPAEFKTEDQKDLNTRRVGIGAAFGLYVAPKFGVSNGGTIDFDATWRIPTSARARVEVGLGGTFVMASDATMGGVSIPLRFVAGVSRRTEMEVGVSPFYSRITFDAPYFEPIHVFGARFQGGIGWTLGSHFQLGISPVVVGIMGSSDVDLLFTYEPKVWMRVAFL